MNDCGLTLNKFQKNLSEKQVELEPVDGNSSAKKYSTHKLIKLAEAEPFQFVKSQSKMFSTTNPVKSKAFRLPSPYAQADPMLSTTNTRESSTIEGKISVIPFSIITFVLSYAHFVCFFLKKISYIKIGKLYFHITDYFQFTVDELLKMFYRKNSSGDSKYVLCTQCWT